jgi:hypothetical protein
MAIGRVPGATGIQPTIVDAKGDLIVATAADSVTRQAVGTNNQVLTADSAQTNGIKWANGSVATLTTTGDIIYASAANTPARLGIGSSGQVLSVSGGVPAWGAAPSGDVVLLTSGSMSGTAVSFNNVFSSTYNNYYLYWNTQDTDGIQRIRLRVSGADNTTTNYVYVNQSVGFGGTPAFGNLTNSSGADYWLDLPDGAAGQEYQFEIGFSGHIDGSLLDRINYQGFFNRRTSVSGVCFGAFAAGTAFDGFTVYNTGSTFSGTYALYAFKK